MNRVKFLVVGVLSITMLLSATGSLGYSIADKVCYDALLHEEHMIPIGPQLDVTTDKETYEVGELVTIYLTNVGDEVLCGGGPIVTIYDQDDAIVYQLGCYCYWELEPGEYIEWIPWDQTNQQNEQVPVGTYVAEGFLSDGEEGYIDTATFAIVN